MMQFFGQQHQSALQNVKESEQNKENQASKSNSPDIDNSEMVDLVSKMKSLLNDQSTEAKEIVTTEVSIIIIIILIIIK